MGEATRIKRILSWLNEEGALWKGEYKFVKDAEGDFELLGIGGSAHVYEARKEKDSKSYAIKIIGFDGAIKEEDFTKIVEIQRKLTKQNVVNIHQIASMEIFDSPEGIRLISYSDDGGVIQKMSEMEESRHKETRKLNFILMDKLQPIKSETRITPESLKNDGAEVKKLVEEIGGVLEKLHETSIAHRDIKPENIFYDCEEEGAGRKNGKYLLGDFGIAKDIIPGTSAKTLAYTPGYGAPEVFRLGKDGYAPKLADIYSFGKLLYALLNDMDPGGDQDLQRPKYASDMMWNIIEKACQYEPSDRYQSMKDFLADLKDVDSQNVFNDAFSGQSNGEPVSHFKLHVTPMEFVEANKLETPKTALSEPNISKNVAVKQKDIPKAVPKGVEEKQKPEELNPSVKTEGKSGEAPVNKTNTLARRMSARELRAWEKMIKKRVKLREECDKNRREFEEKHLNELASSDANFWKKYEKLQRKENKYKKQSEKLMERSIKLRNRKNTKFRERTSAILLGMIQFLIAMLLLEIRIQNTLPQGFQWQLYVMSVWVLGAGVVRLAEKNKKIGNLSRIAIYIPAYGLAIYSFFTVGVQWPMVMLLLCVTTCFGPLMISGAISVLMILPLSILATYVDLPQYLQNGLGWLIFLLLLGGIFMQIRGIQKKHDDAMKLAAGVLLLGILFLLTGIVCVILQKVFAVSLPAILGELHLVWQGIAFSIAGLIGGMSEVEM